MANPNNKFSLQSVMAEFTPLSKGLAVIMVLGFILQFLFPPLRSMFGLVTGLAIQRPWQFFTSALFETNPFGLVSSVMGVLYLSKLIEPHYGTREYSRLILFSAVGAGICTFVTIAIVYYVIIVVEKRGTGDHISQAGKQLYIPVSGFHACIGALLVAVKHVVPDNEVTLFSGAVSFKAKQLPVIYVLTTTLFSLPFHAGLRVGCFVFFGTYSGWLYLRYFRDGGGDYSEEFRFASFFPQPLQPAVESLAQTSSKLTRLGAHSQNDRDAEQGFQLTSSLLPLASDSAASRRRERGTKVLEQRLGARAAAALASKDTPLEISSSDTSPEEVTMENVNAPGLGEGP